MSDEREAINRANDMRAKRISKDMPVLSIKDQIKFLGFIERGVNNREINMRMGLSPYQIAAMKKHMKIITVNDIKTKVTALENQLDKLRRESAQQTKTMDAVNPRKPRKDNNKLPDGAILKSNVPNMDYARRNRRIDQIIQTVENLDDDWEREFKIPEREIKSFQMKLHLGLRYWSTHYEVPKCVILKEILRLNPTIDLDTLNS